jgi:uroporphyrinogen decarboxylase
MNSRERVLRGIERTQPDRVPIDFGGVCWSIVDSPFMPHHPYFELCKHLGIEDYEKPITGPLMFEVDNVDERIRQIFGVDIRYMFPHDLPLRYDPRGGAVIGTFGMRTKPVGYYGTPDVYPMRDLNTIQEIEKYPDWPDLDHPVYKQEGLREEALALRQKFEEYAIGIELGNLCGVQFDLAEMMFGIDRWLYNLKNRPDLHHAWMNKYLRTTDKIAENILRQVGDVIDIVVVYNDFGTQQGPYVSHDDYVKHLKPYEEQLIQRVKKWVPNAKILMHSCGSIYTVIKDRAEMGVDVLNPMNPLAKNMNAEYLKEHFGDIMSFHGGVDIQRLLPFGTVEKIKEELKRLIKIWMPLGGWIAAPSHNIQPDTPPENIIAMYETLQEFGDGDFITEI